MKKILVVLVVMIACNMHAIGQSMLRVRLTDNSRINVAVDERYFKKTGTSVTVGDLPYGRHRLKIYAIRTTRRGREFTDLVFEGSVKTYDGTITQFVFDPYKRDMDISEHEIKDFNFNRSPGGNEWEGRGIMNNNYDEPNNGNDNGRSASPVASPISEDRLGTLNEAKLNELKAKVTAKSTDTDRMKILMEALKNDQITTNQVGDIMDWLLFENSKVDFVKWAYPITVDKEYYSELDSKFAYKTSQEELEKFINAHK